MIRADTSCPDILAVGWSVESDEHTYHFALLNLGWIESGLFLENIDLNTGDMELSVLPVFLNRNLIKLTTFSADSLLMHFYSS